MVNLIINKCDVIKAKRRNKSMSLKDAVLMLKDALRGQVLLATHKFQELFSRMRRKKCCCNQKMT